MATEKQKIENQAETAEIIADSVDDENVLFPEEGEVKEGEEKFYQAVGRRKNSIARIRLFTKKSTDQVKSDQALITVNDKNYSDYFTDSNLKLVVESALRKLKSLNRFKATVVVSGGGLSGQAESIRHGMARALILFDVNFKKKLKKAGFLTRDPRVKERRKYGKKKARKSPQWSKR
ncbi:MAG: 30S ribosomal protein S9 [Candidatus Yanofskybacteria bacterium GW2011_GWA1_44_21]|uniref:Small ribosomal subunit protein uS9 n=1 Tax=Candidatus Yanofskybacteria bacterium GW2011_GWB1_45_11 TaxID=1619026 RepID=A0A0G1L3G2_9BACT|nr:MAG: 30S ribosomal protein S9 [Candidatus Yanofskybacteria bacterium GW2011_GWA2_44_10]KKT50523.1 MAG: 30S ribosomal protein S9 [Candidatus Yanofskybacteria bacterium GW2011_GWA1_44_21]KKT90285.1 MAG: 30S ribosomal protein S9 [Candidatus Yanofskybacteria bacterium GW2011_GWB1_45_11]